MKGFGSANFDRRRYPRLDFSLPLAFQSMEQAMPDGLSGNVSLGGMMAYLPRTVMAGQLLDVTLLLPLGEEKKVCRVKAKVIWAKNGEFEGGWVCQVGLGFVDMLPESQQVWKDFLCSWQGDT